MSIGDDWQDYNRNVLPRNAGAIQRIETRRAFYAGALSVIRIMNEVGGPGVTEEQGVDMLTALSKDVFDFHRNIRG